MPVPESTLSLVAACDAISVVHHTASGDVEALREVSATFPSGRLTVVAGPSGSGKSSLLRVLAGLQVPQRGSAFVAGEEISRLRSSARRRLRRRKIGVVLQSPADNLVDYLSAIEQVRLAAELRGTDPGEAERLLAMVDLTGRADQRPALLSGGEQQRVAFAAAVVGQPAVLVADEPTAQLDASSGRTLVDSLLRLVDDGCAAIVASHDDGVIDRAHEVVWLHDGRVVPR